MARRRLEVGADGLLRWVEDISPVLEQNKRIREQGGNWSASRNMREFARIPAIAILQWEQQYGKEFVETLFKDSKMLREFLQKYHPEFLV